jgi:hypothetical protein
MVATTSRRRRRRRRRGHTDHSGVAARNGIFRHIFVLNLYVSNTRLLPWGRQSLVVIKRQRALAIRWSPPWSRCSLSGTLQRCCPEKNNLRQPGSLRRRLPTPKVSSPRRKERQLDGTQSAGRGRDRAGHREHGRRGIDRRDVRGLLTVAAQGPGSVESDHQAAPATLQ